jgi:hypothetical protein
MTASGKCSARRQVCREPVHLVVVSPLLALVEGEAKRCGDCVAPFKSGNAERWRSEVADELSGNRVPQRSPRSTQSQSRTAARVSIAR